MVKGKPKRDGSGRGVGRNVGRGGCKAPRASRRGRRQFFLCLKRNAYIILMRKSILCVYEDDLLF